MRLEWQILCAVALDLAAGDPRWLPHPVRGIGWVADRMESITRRWIGWQRGAGILAAAGTYAIAGTVAWVAIWLAAWMHPAAGDAVSIVLIYTTIAAKDLARHSMAVYRPLASGNLQEARKRVGMIVGRDTHRLDESGVARAAVESVAESTVDGVTAPLMFAMLAGPVGAVVYRAINTLDSMFGHKDEKYRYFGWASARVDDLANFIPARVTAPLMCLAAGLLEGRTRMAAGICWRDARHHASPNSGLTEACMAGALGVQLGGVNYYDGEAVIKPTIGQANEPLSAKHILRANALMLLTTGLFVATGLAVRWLIVHGWRAA